MKKNSNINTRGKRNVDDKKIKSKANDNLKPVLNNKKQSHKKSDAYVVDRNNFEKGKIIC